MHSKIFTSKERERDQHHAITKRLDEERSSVRRGPPVQFMADIGGPEGVPGDAPGPGGQGCDRSTRPRIYTVAECS